MNGAKPASLDFRSNEMPYFFLSLSLSFIQPPQARRSFTYDPIFCRKFHGTLSLSKANIPLLLDFELASNRSAKMALVVEDRTPFVRTFADPFPRIRIVGASRTSFLSSSVLTDCRWRANFVVLPPLDLPKMARMFGERIISPLIIHGNNSIRGICKLELYELRGKLYNDKCYNFYDAKDLPSIRFFNKLYLLKIVIVKR